MEIEEQIRGLDVNAEVFKALFTAVPGKMRTWRPRPDSWNVHEVVCHLADEETDDFRARTLLALSGGGGVLKPIDPQGWILDREYAGRDFETEVQRFLLERQRSVTWLRSLQEPDWDAFFRHPKHGTMKARKLLANWLAHDYHHFRQVNTIKYYFLRETGGQDLGYAGNWNP